MVKLKITIILLNIIIVIIEGGCNLINYIRIIVLSTFMYTQFILSRIVYYIVININTLYIMSLQPCSWRATTLKISAPTPIKHTWTS